MEQQIAHGGETRDRHPRPINFRFPLRLSGQRVNRDRANWSRISLQSTAESSQPIHTGSVYRVMLERQRLLPMQFRPACPE